MTDLVSPELRKVERLVDSAYKTNLLMKKPFAEAAWHFPGPLRRLLRSSISGA